MTVLLDEATIHRKRDKFADRAPRTASLRSRPLNASPHIPGTNPTLSRATTSRSTDALDYQLLPRPLAAMAKSFPDGHLIERHHHARAQLVYAVSGVMTIETDVGTWLVPPDRALWIPAGVPHQIRVAGELQMRTLYVRDDASAHLPQKCVVLAVSALLRELVIRATRLPVLYDQDGPDGAVMGLILAEIGALPSLPFHLPMPSDRRLVKLCRLVCEDLSTSCSREFYAARVGVSARSVTRLFKQQTGMGFAQWRQKARLLAALQRLGAGESVTSVALALGYRSPSAFTAMFRRVLGLSPRRCLRER